MSAFTGAIFTAAEIEDDRIVYTIHDGSFTQAVYTGGVLNRGYHTDPHSGQLSTLVMFLVQNYLRIVEAQPKASLYQAFGSLGVS